jgi:hypothetical protein
LKTGIAVCLVLVGAVLPGIAQQRRSVTEKIEWTYSDKTETPDAALPNVLLVGDSITRAYYASVAEDMAGKANCYYFASSTSIGDERLAPQLAEYFKMIGVRFDVVHFNNGMHGWGYTEEEYKRYFPEMLAAVRAGAPGAMLIWASTTPVRKDQPNGATNERVVARNAIAASFMAKEKVPIDDQHALMMGHQTSHSDDIHFTAEGSTIQARQVADSLVTALSTSAAAHHANSQ